MQSNWSAQKFISSALSELKEKHLDVIVGLLVGSLIVSNVKYPFKQKGLRILIPVWLWFTV
jgi:hypothetical protein